MESKDGSCEALLSEMAEADIVLSGQRISRMMSRYRLAAVSGIKVTMAQDQPSITSLT